MPFHPTPQPLPTHCLICLPDIKNFQLMTGVINVADFLTLSLFVVHTLHSAKRSSLPIRPSIPSDTSAWRWADRSRSVYSIGSILIQYVLLPILTVYVAHARFCTVINSHLEDGCASRNEQPASSCPRCHIGNINMFLLITIYVVIK